MASKTAKHITLRTQLARFPFVKGLDAFAFGYQPSLRYVIRHDWIATSVHISLIGLLLVSALEFQWQRRNFSG